VSGWLRSTLLALALVASCRGTALAAEPDTQSERARAASAYDSGVRAFDQNDYSLAARRFLEADALLPNEDALLNALVAAKRSAEPGLVREAAERVLARPHADATLTNAARSALSALPADPAAAAVSPAPLEAAPAPAPPAAAAATVTTPAPPESRADAQPDASTHTWARPVFYAGVGVTAVLTGLTIWSGMDALAARDQLPGTQAETDAVVARGHRTDALLAGTLLAAAGTVYVGVGWVDWGSGAKPVRVAAQLSSTRALVALRGSF
jgi:hypothetical protein